MTTIYQTNQLNLTSIMQSTLPTSVRLVRVNCMDPQHLACVVSIENPANDHALRSHLDRVVKECKAAIRASGCWPTLKTITIVRMVAKEVQA